MEKLWESFKSNKEYIADYIQSEYGVSLHNTDIFPMSKYLEIAAKSQNLTPWMVEMLVSKVVMKVLENIHGAWLAGHETIFYSQSLLGLTLSDTNMLQICAHEFGHILTEKIIGSDRYDKMSFELSDWFADYIAYQVLKDKFGEEFKWYWKKDNLELFQKLLIDKWVTDSEWIIKFVEENVELRNV